MRTMSWAMVWMAILALAVGCGGDDSTDSGDGTTTQTAGGDSAESADDHGHDHDHDHGHSHDGERYELGSLTIGASEVAVIQVGELTSGGSVVFEMQATGGEDAISAIRIWVGNEAGEGSIKQKAGADGGGHYHAHVELDETWPEDSQVWIEIETADGSERGAYPLGSS